MSTADKQGHLSSSSAAFPSARSEAFHRRMGELVVELCAVDTTPQVDIAQAAAAESRTFDLIERELRAAGLAGLSLRRAPIDPRIGAHPFFTPLYYTQSSDLPNGLDAARGYAGRCNLLACFDGDGRGRGAAQAINVHIDVVRPFFPPVRRGDVIHSRGACDNKGNVAALLGAVRLLGEHCMHRRTRLNHPLTCMFVIDEETGGNGSLSLAIDHTLKECYDSLLVLECTGGRLHPGNRGCVWYRVDGTLPDVNLFEASAYVIGELEDEGRAIRAESDHPLYPHRPVQTCHGILGHCGEHPSRINGDVSFRIGLPAEHAADGAAALIGDVLADGVRAYVAQYGDKTAEVVPGNGQPRLARHLDVAIDPGGITVRVHGLTGHMSAIRENDGAITKLAALVRALVRSRSAIERVAGCTMHLSLLGWSDASRLVLEGGQGFVPTHDLNEVERRVRGAVWRGMRRYFDIAGVDADPAEAVRVTFDKLHNAAFARPADSNDMAHAIAAARQAGTWAESPIVGWDASCDARIFACEYPELPVITGGAGALQDAHSDRESIDVNDVVRTAEFLADFVLRQTGTA